MDLKAINDFFEHYQIRNDFFCIFFHNLVLLIELSLHMLPKTLLTERLKLLRWEASFAAPYADLCSDPEVMAYIAKGLPYSPERAFTSQQKISDHWDRLGYGMYAMFEKEGNELIGIAGLATADYLVKTPPLPEIGWRLKKRLWGKGIASEATRAILETLQQNQTLPELCAVIHIDNDRSQALAARLGFKLLGEDVDRDFQNRVQVWGFGFGEGRGVGKLYKF